MAMRIQAPLWLAKLLWAMGAQQPDALPVVEKNVRISHMDTEYVITNVYQEFPLFGEPTLLFQAKKVDKPKSL